MLLIACDAATTPRAEAVAAPPDQAARCDDGAADGEVLATFAGEICPLTLIAGDGAGAVTLLAREQPPRTLARGETPEGCPRARCRYSGVSTPAGPLILAERPARGGEVAAAAWLGLAAGGALAFTPLWIDEPAVGDDSELGPVFALEARVCGDALVLAAARRLPTDTSERASEAAEATGGAHALVDGELVRVGPAPPGPCAGVELPYP